MRFELWKSNLTQYFNPVKLGKDGGEGVGGGRVIFVRGKFKFKLFLSDLWYEPETL